MRWAQEIQVHIYIPSGSVCYSCSNLVMLPGSWHINFSFGGKKCWIYKNTTFIMFWGSGMFTVYITWKSLPRRILWLYYMSLSSSHVDCFKLAYDLLVLGLQEELNRGKPNWEHLNDELHVLITVEDTENRATMKMQRAVEEVKKLLIPVVSGFQPSASFSWQPVFNYSVSPQHLISNSESTSHHTLINLEAPRFLYIGQAFRYSPEYALYIFNQQIYFIIWYLLDHASMI